MPEPKVDPVSERPFEELVQGLSQQAGAMARAQIEVARRELIAMARPSGSGVAMVGGGAFLFALASGTGTSALILLLSRRSGASAAALGVTGAYAGAGALLAREGLTRLREAGPPPPGDQAEGAKRQLESGKRRTKPSPKRSPKPAGRSAPKSQGARRGTSRTTADRARRRAS